MGKTVTLRIIEHDGTNEERSALRFDDADWAALEDFAKYATELQDESSLVREGISASLSVKWSESEGFKVDAQLPPKESMYAMLELLRPFLLEKERTNFRKVRNILKRATESKRVRQHLETLEFIYSGRHLQSLVVVAASSPDFPEGTIINSDDMLQTWLNAYRFHRDKDKQELFDAMHKIMPPDSSIAWLMFLIKDKVSAILALRQIIFLVAGRLETIYAAFILPEPMRYLVYIHATVLSFSFLENQGDERALPEEGPPFERVIALTHLGPASVTQFIDLIARMWLHNELLAEIGTRHYLFRVSKGFRLPDGRVHEHETDIFVTLKLQALLAEEPLSFARRKPVEATLKRMNMEREGETSFKMLLRPFDSKEALEAFLNVEPKPEVEWIVVPRVAYEFAYWPVSKQAKERVKKILEKGGKPTFEEVEGDVSRAWEFLGEGDEDKEKS